MVDIRRTDVRTAKNSFKRHLMCMSGSEKTPMNDMSQPTMKQIKIPEPILFNNSHLISTTFLYSRAYLTSELPYTQATPNFASNKPLSSKGRSLSCNTAQSWTSGRSRKMCRFNWLLHKGGDMFLSHRHDTIDSWFWNRGNCWGTGSSNNTLGHFFCQKLSI